MKNFCYAEYNPDKTNTENSGLPDLRRLRLHESMSTIVGELSHPSECKGLNKADVYHLYSTGSELCHLTLKQGV